MTLSIFGDFAILKRAIYLDAEKTLNETTPGLTIGSLGLITGILRC